MHEKTRYLENKTVLVTGGTAGIGREIARVFCLHGASVVILGTNEKNAQETLHLLEKTVHLSTQIIDYKIADVSCFASLQEVQKQLQKTVSCFDILINNAGITRDNLLLRMSEKDFDEVISINLKGVFLVCKIFLPAMLKKRKGNVVNISSVIGVMGNAGQLNYAASKGGVISFTKSLAKEVAKRNIRVNALAPGPIATKMTEKLSEDAKKVMLEKVPLRTFGSVTDVANAAFFLASDFSNYITGQTLHVDGGMVM